jgi:2-oxoglutarate ferredoxin oxidoreductase subunit delta
MSCKITVDPEICKGCSLCVAACPKKLMELDKSKLNAKGYHAAVCIDDGACISCAMCAIMCPDSAITVKKEG